MPSWPLDPDAETTDERTLWALAEGLSLDRSDYREVVIDAIELTLTREYRILHMAVTGMLDYTPRIDADLFLRVYALARQVG